jgi:hypothetical protein
MPLPTVLFIAFATGAAAAIASRVDLRVSPRHALLTGSFAAYLLFVAFVLLPIAAYFYVFHGDWFLLYMADVSRVPSALALIGIGLVGVVGALGFAVGAVFVRSQHDTLAWIAVSVPMAAAIAVVPVFLRPLGRVGSYVQYHRDFGLDDYLASTAWQGTAAMSACLAVGFGFLVLRLRASGRRRR